MRGITYLIILFLTAVVEAIPMAAETFDGYADRREITGRLSRLPLVSIEGIWLFPATGQIVVVEREDDDAMQFRVVAALSSRTGIECGTLIGRVVPTAKNGVFDAVLAGIAADGSVRSDMIFKKGANRFTLSLAGDRLAFTPVRRGIKANWWRLFPYMFRFSVRTYDTRQPGLDGCIRLWPRDPSVPPYQPRYL
ncbi:MAG: hypothetical protein K2J97_02500 [Muribaculaceae bacterium]|nr:hypothetical protein [Muribaculaceae bacterium]MDE6644935.1 hypothetical protein [Muribaculaceae bacterium]